MKLQLGEVVPIRMRFHEAAGAKARPAVVLLDAETTTLWPLR